jgi:hypothetical protein
MRFSVLEGGGVSSQPDEREATALSQSLPDAGKPRLLGKASPAYWRAELVIGRDQGWCVCAVAILRAAQAVWKLLG